MDVLFAWTLVIGALVGAVFNSYGKYLICYRIWVVTNFFLCIANFRDEDYAQAFLFFAYFLTSINGLYNLHKTQSEGKSQKKRSRTHKNDKLVQTKKNDKKNAL